MIHAVSGKDSDASTGPELLILVPLYPIWGIIQQFIFQGILHRRLQQVSGSDWVAILATSLIFAAIHIADLRITGLVMIAGLYWSWSFSRTPNLWTLGVSHGVLAVLAYYLLLGEQTLQKIF